MKVVLPATIVGAALTAFLLAGCPAPLRAHGDSFDGGLGGAAGHGIAGANGGDAGRGGTTGILGHGGMAGVLGGGGTSGILGGGGTAGNLGGGGRSQDAQGGVAGDSRGQTGGDGGQTDGIGGASAEQGGRPGTAGAVAMGGRSGIGGAVPSGGGAGAGGASGGPWALQLEGLQIIGIAAMPDDTFVVGGTFSGTVALPSGAHFVTLGASDILLVHFSSEGAVLSAAHEGGGGNDILTGIAAVGTDGIAVAGTFDGTIIVGEGTAKATSLVSRGSSDMFLAAFSVDGDVRWVRQGGGSEVDYGGPIVTLFDGSIATTGNFSMTATFDDKSVESAGGTDVFIARYGSNGQLKWVFRNGGTGYDTGLGISATADGGILVTGSFEGGPFSPGQGVVVSLPDSGDTSDAFLARFDSGGGAQWVTRINGDGATTGRTIRELTDGRIVTSGYCGSNTTFYSTSITSLTRTSTSGRYVATYSSQGIVDGAHLDWGGVNTVSAAEAGAYVVSGEFQGALGPLSSIGGLDAMAIRYAGNGTVQAALQGGGAADDSATTHAILADGRLVLAGTFKGMATFGPAPNKPTLSSLAEAGASFLAVLKL
jgi:hypothetical protein